MIYLKLETKDRKTKVKGIRYQFRSYNKINQRYEAIPIETLPEYIRNCQSDAVAKQYCQTKSAEENAIKSRIQKRKEWEEKFHNYAKLLNDFGEDHQLKAPNSWKNDVYYLDGYVFPFFLGKQLSSNLHEWPLHYHDFKKWLSDVKPMKYNIDRLAINTQNKIIKALNLFLRYYSESNPTEVEIKKCSVYPREMCKISTAADVLEKHEVEPIWEALKKIRPMSADLFYVLTQTGMRINEAIGTCLAFVNEGEIEGKKARSYHQLIKKYDLSYYGYLVLESQPRYRVPRDKGGIVPRKPLKSRKTIEHKYFRYIPLFDKDAWKIIARLSNERMNEIEQRKWGKDPKDYLLFNGMTATMFYLDLKRAFEMTKLRFRSPHKVGRHTYLTWLYDVTYNDATLAEIIVGHRDKKTMENYSHLAEQVGREQQRTKSNGKRFKVID
jgi:integrase